MEEWLNEWENWIVENLKDGAGTDKGRARLAYHLGYVDARMMVHFMETNGLPLSLGALQASKHGLKVYFCGLRVELERIGKKPDTIESELREVRFFMDQAAQRQSEAA